LNGIEKWKIGGAADTLNFAGGQLTSTARVQYGLSAAADVSEKKGDGTISFRSEVSSSKAKGERTSR
jgi:hypothetical protein